MGILRLPSTATLAIFLSFPFCVTSSNFCPPLPSQVSCRGGGIMYAGVLTCHMGPWSCNQNSFWAALCALFEHAQFNTHTRLQICEDTLFPILSSTMNNMHNQPLLIHKHYTCLYKAYPINNTGFLYGLFKYVYGG